MSNNKDINRIGTQLRELNLRQASLLARLEEANNRQIETDRAFAIGNRVRILSPRIHQQQKTGHITRIDASRTMVQTNNGTKITSTKESHTWLTWVQALECQWQQLQCLKDPHHQPQPLQWLHHLTPPLEDEDQEEGNTEAAVAEGADRET